MLELFLFAERDVPPSLRPAAQLAGETDQAGCWRPAEVFRSQLALQAHPLGLACDQCRDQHAETSQHALGS